MSVNADTIAALATPSGRGGVGIIRVSGSLCGEIAKKILGFIPKPRLATFTPFKSAKEILDEGVALYFSAPHSFTGEDVLELQGHGGPVVLDLVLKTVIESGARLAQPGEFSLRAFLNNKMDLTQAEAIADLINADSEQAAKSAMRSMQGEFSKRIHQLVSALIQLRVLIEAAIDFPEEEIDFITEVKVAEQLEQLALQLQEVLKTAQQGALLREGMTVVIAGEPNAGKSSLLNCLSGRQSAIVTEIAGTTRDILREHIHIDGMPLHILDTAGLRKTNDVVEQEGVRRAQQAILHADLVLLVIDGTKFTDLTAEITRTHLETLFDQPFPPLAVVVNKMDLTKESVQRTTVGEHTVIKISAKSGNGTELLKEYLKEVMGFSQQQEGVFIARRRHLDALTRAATFLQTGAAQLKQHRAAELLAEDLRQAQLSLSEITGEFSSDDLLGEIFSSFCIGK